MLREEFLHPLLLLTLHRAPRVDAHAVLRLVRRHALGVHGGAAALPKQTIDSSEECHVRIDAALAHVGGRDGAREAKVDEEELAVRRALHDVQRDVLVVVEHGARRRQRAVELRDARALRRSKNAPLGGGNISERAVERFHHKAAVPFVDAPRGKHAGREAALCSDALELNFGRDS